jgi:uncharacterized membrane protein YfcA
VLGAFGGVWLNHLLRGNVVMLLFSALMLAAALSLLRSRAGGPPVASFEERYRATSWLRLGLVGLGVGFLTGFFGVGGGFLIVPALVVLLGLPMQFAVGTSLVAVSLNALWGLLGNLQLGTLDWTMTGLFALGGLAGVLVGGRFAGRVPDRTLRAAFAVVVVGLAVYTFGRSMTSLLVA